MKTRRQLVNLSGWLVTVLTPLIIIMISVRLLITPLFARVQYQLPGFPQDPYGFSHQERLIFSEPSIKYLVNTEDISYLASLTFEDGTPIYNARELDHMEDVKAVVTGMRIALTGSLIFLAVIGYFAVKNGWKADFLVALQRGGWAIIGLVAAILIFVVLSFDQLFHWFHQIFFESGTWQFHPSNTLIRLFPIRFWRDAFVFVGLITVLLGCGVILSCRNNEPSQTIRD